jgi:hypothetical protein
MPEDRTTSSNERRKRSPVNIDYISKISLLAQNSCGGKISQCCFRSIKESTVSGNSVIKCCSGGRIGL